MKLNKIIQCLEEWAPPIYQENYDNSGLMVGDKDSQINGCLICLDCTENVIEEAVNKKCNLIISHHPIIFGEFNSIDFSTWEGKVIGKAIKNNINIYSIHTNLDNVNDGVNKKICDLLGLLKTKILAPKTGFSNKLEIYIPEKNKNFFLKKIYEIGGGHIGNYKECSFQSKGKGTFIPTENSNPSIGNINKKEIVDEIKLEIFFDKKIKNTILNIIEKYHPYDEVSYYITQTSNPSKHVGSGMIGKRKIKFETLLNELKKKFNKNSIRHTKKIKNEITNIAVCGGSGSFLIGESIRNNAEVYITSDLKYHDYFKSNNKIVLIDIGHYESEQFTKELIFEYLSKKLINIALHLSNENTNPIKYF